MIGAEMIATQMRGSTITCSLLLFGGASAAVTEGPRHAPGSPLARQPHSRVRLTCAKRAGSVRVEGDSRRAAALNFLWTEVAEREPEVALSRQTSPKRAATPQMDEA